VHWVDGLYGVKLVAKWHGYSLSIHDRIRIL